MKTINVHNVDYTGLSLAALIICAVALLAAGIAVVALNICLQNPVMAACTIPLALVLIVFGIAILFFIIKDIRL